MKRLHQIFLLALLIGHCFHVFANNDVFSYLDNEDFNQLDLYLAEHDINALYGDSSSTLLVYSILYNKSRVTQYLIKKGADVNQYLNGKSPLMYAAEKGYKAKVSLLVSHKAEINALDADKNTALILAVRSGDIKTVKYLVRNGSALNHKNIFRATAYDESINFAHREISKYLRDEYIKNLPDFHDGPYVKWNGKRRIKALYMVHDSARRMTFKTQASFKAESNPFLLKGFSRDSQEYLISKRREIQSDQFQGVKRILVIGDIHGGYDSLLVFLQNNGIIDHGLNWIWGKGHLVFLGDIFDRGDKVTEALWLIYRLDDQAVNAGGAVHLILGNHELMIMNYDDTYVADKYLIMADRLNLTYAGLYSKKTILGQWLRSKNTIVKINDYLFVHAGLSPSFVNAGFSLHEINEHVRFFLDFPTRETHGDVSRETILGKDGPFWYRGYLEDNHKYKRLPEEKLDRVLSAFQADKIFIGHTNVRKITPLYHSKVYAMDVPFYSDWYEIQGITIDNDVFYLVNSSGRKEKIR